MPYAVQAIRLPTQTLFDLKGDGPALAAWLGDAAPPLPEAPNRLTRRGAATLAHIGPDRWLLRAPLSEEAALLGALRPDAAPPELSVLRVSDTLSFLQITGPEADAVLAIASPLDTHPDAFPADACTFTEAFGLKALLTRCPDGYDLAVERSYAAFLADCLARAIG